MWLFWSEKEVGVGFNSDGLITGMKLHSIILYELQLRFTMSPFLSTWLTSDTYDIWSFSQVLCITWGDLVIMIRYNFPFNELSNPERTPWWNVWWILSLFLTSPKLIKCTFPCSHIIWVKGTHRVKSWYTSNLDYWTWFMSIVFHWSNNIQWWGGLVHLLVHVYIFSLKWSFDSE